jgi:hypothetical protein
LDLNVSADDLNARVMRLAEMLERFRAPDPQPGAASANPVAARLDSIADERMRRLAAMLKERLSEPAVDAADALLLRLLLDEYSAGVRQLRAAARAVEERLNAARSVIAESRRAAAAARARAESTPHSAEH